MRSLTRRHILKSLIGIPAATALSGCRREANGPLPPGELVGASNTVGHVLQHDVRISVPEEQVEKCRVVIVGGGVAGLSAARRLLSAGVNDFVVLELEDAPGGTSRSGECESGCFPWGAHYVPAPCSDNPALCTLFDEMGVFDGVDGEGNPLVAEQYRCRYPQERVFFKGRWLEGLYLAAGATSEDVMQLQRFQQEIDFWVAWRDGQGRRAFTIPMAAGSDDSEVQKLDQLSMADWLDQNGFTSPRLQWFVDYACRDDYGSRAAHTSAWAGLFYFASRKRQAGTESRPFITWPDGNGRIVRHLAKGLEGRLRLGATVVRIVPGDAPKPSSVTVYALTGVSQTPQAYRADKVIFSAPHFLAPRIIESYPEKMSRVVYQKFEYGAWAVANLMLRRLPPSYGFPTAWDNVFYESPSLGYVATSYQRGVDFGPAILTYYYALCEETSRRARWRLLDTDRDGWAEIALADLQRGHPGIRSLVERIDVMRWGHAMILPRPGFMFGSARKNAARPHRGIHFAHSDLSGLPLFEEAFYRGTLAAEQTLGELGEDIRSIL